MHQFVQSAIEAAKQGDNKKALEFLKQVLNANPNDVDAWLVLAAVVDDPARKRQCLKRVLALDPVNQVAREELLEMDRAAMGGQPEFTPASLAGRPGPASTTDYQPEAISPYYASDTSAFEVVPSEEKTVPPPPPSQVPAPAKTPARQPKEKTLVFKYPLVWRIVIYVFVVIFGCSGLIVATNSITASLPLLGLAVLMLVSVLTVFPTVEVSGKGIRAAGIFSSGETGWDEIVKIKSNAMKRRLELTKRGGQVVNVSTQVGGYPKIIEILQKKRPDLFGLEARPQTQTSAFPSSQDYGASARYGNESPAPAPAFKGPRTFKKSFFKQYGSYLIVLPLLFFAAYAALTEPQNRLGAGIAAVFCLIMFVLPLFQVSAVKLEAGRLTIETMFEEKVLNAGEIREIKMDTVRGRYGQATNYVNIIPLKGKNYPLQGFSEGDEIMYGLLTNWWNAHRAG